MLGVTLLMDGGTASVYAPRAWEAFLEFYEPDPSDDADDGDPGPVSSAGRVGARSSGS